MRGGRAAADAAGAAAAACRPFVVRTVTGDGRRPASEHVRELRAPPLAGMVRVERGRACRA